jgi:hypothetical protein
MKHTIVALAFQMIGAGDVSPTACITAVAYKRLERELIKPTGTKIEAMISPSAVSARNVVRRTVARKKTARVNAKKLKSKCGCSHRRR